MVHRFVSTQKKQPTIAKMSNVNIDSTIVEPMNDHMIGFNFLLIN